jgi:hypothetical protein
VVDGEDTYDTLIVVDLVPHAVLASSGAPQSRERFAQWRPGSTRCLP